MNARCVVCDTETDTPVRDALSHFRLYRSGQWRWLRGNIRQFGFWSGLSGTLGLAFPIYTTLRHWKYRKFRLSIPHAASLEERPNAGTTDATESSGVSAAGRMTASSGGGA